MSYQIKAPVLLITFNRPENTKKVLDKIKIEKPPKLYIFNDGPREHNENDEIARQEIKEMIRSIDWQCEIKTNYQDSNLGCGQGVSTAITWAFTNEEYLIILEDDCVPSGSFFRFCDELLEKYKNDTRIWVISGSNFNDEYEFNNSYTFSNYVHIWGWATWKRCWMNFVPTLTDWPEFKKIGGFNNVFRSDKICKYFNNLYERLYRKNNLNYITWDYQFCLKVYSNNGLCIFPQKNLISNIGHKGVHSKSVMKAHDMTMDNLFRITNHPKFIINNTGYELYHFDNHILKLKSTFYKKIIKHLKKDL